MAALCAHLDDLHPAEARTATQIGIDTGRRPEDILALPVDCLQHDKDGSPVLIYNNAKADRLARRLPITQATAAVITEQQERVRARFPEPRSVSSNCCPLRGATPMGEKLSRWTRSRAGTVNGSPGWALCGAATAPNSTTPESSSTPTGTPTLNDTRMPVCRSTCWPNYLITEI